MSKQDAPRAMVLGGMVTVLLLVALARAGAEAAQVLELPTALGWAGGLGLAALLSRVLLRRISTR